jgi:hypothetical protein
MPLPVTLVTAVVAAGAGGGSALASSPKTTNITRAVEAAHWSSNVAVKAAGGSVTISSNGLPSTEYWTRPSEYAVPNTGVIVPTAKTAHVAKDPTVATAISITIPAKPTYETTTTATSLGPIGIMLSGAPLYDPYEGNGSTVALASNFSLKSSDGKSVYFIDGCYGHPTPMGAYHYHGMPTCITEKVDGSHGPSHLIGVALDGFPIYGDRDIHGKIVPLSKLDKCNGIFSPTPEFPHGIYHYVLTDDPSDRSSLRCYHGKVSSNLSGFTRSNVYRCVMASMAGMKPDRIGARRELHTYSWRTGAHTVFLPASRSGR